MRDLRISCRYISAIKTGQLNRREAAPIFINGLPPDTIKLPPHVMTLSE